MVRAGAEAPRLGVTGAEARDHGVTGAGAEARVHSLSLNDGQRAVGERGSLPPSSKLLVL